MNPLPEQSEAELLLALRRGESAGFRAIYERYRLRIYGFLVRLCGQRDVADDLLQETFFQLARHAERLTPDTNLSAYLFTVARNRYRSHRRMALFRSGRWRELVGLAAGSPPPPTPLELTAASDTAQRLERALSQLRPPLREVLLLCAVEGLGAEQAAEVLTISPAALRQRLSRARSQLAILLERPEGGGDHGV